MRTLFLSAVTLLGSAAARRVKPAPLCCGWSPSPVVLDATISPLPVTFYLKETNLATLRAEALAVSNPASPRYGDHLTSEEVYFLTQPAQHSLDVVTTWLAANDVSHTVSHSRRVQASIPLNVAASLFNTEFSLLSHPTSNVSVIRAGSYTLPTEVDAVTAAVFGLHGLPLPPRTQIAADKGPKPKKAHVTPAVLAQTYDITGAPTPSGSAKNHQAVAEFQDQTMENDDLAQFFRKYVPNAKHGDDKVAKFMGDANIQSGTDEASLDIQYIMGNNPGLKTEFWYFSSNDFCADLVRWTNLIMDTKDAPLVHSVSYGYQGSMTDLGCEKSKYTVIDDNLAKLAAMGFSILIASGDSGSGYNPSAYVNRCLAKAPKGKAFNGTVLTNIMDMHDTGDCCDAASKLTAAKGGWTFYDHGEDISNECIVYSEIDKILDDPKAFSEVIDTKVRLWPSWPSTSPWVTAVGATRFVGQKVGNAEMAADQFGSGGGFSHMFNRSLAPWQSSVVTEYLSKAPELPPNTSYDAGGRATPDVSALGEGYIIFNAGESEIIGGTSASTPAFAGMVSLLNEARLQNGGKPMGFLNPWLYAHPEAFTDVTLGSDKFGIDDGNGDLIKLKYGFNCTKGWDPVTGLGTPIFSKMLKAALI